MVEKSERIDICKPELGILRQVPSLTLLHQSINSSFLVACFEYIGKLLSQLESFQEQNSAKHLQAIEIYI